MSSFDEYFEKLSSSDETERAYAAEDLSLTNSPEAVAALLAQVHHESSNVVRNAILQGLVRMDGDEVIQGAIGLLMSDEPTVRNLGVAVLRHRLERAISFLEDIPFLEEVMHEGDSDLRKFVLDVLGGMPFNGTEQIYTSALSDRDTNVVITAVENIGKAHATVMRGAVEKLLLTADHPMLEAACITALAEVGDQSSLEALRTRYPRPETMPGFLLVPYLKLIRDLGTESELSETVRLLIAAGRDQGSEAIRALMAQMQSGKPLNPEAHPEEMLKL